jgi:hypothetical protein
LRRSLLCIASGNLSTDLHFINLAEKVDDLSMDVRDVLLSEDLLVLLLVPNLKE